MPRVDAIELEIFKNVFVSIAEEMGVLLGRTALSPNIKERKDFSCSVFTRAERPSPRARTSPSISGPCPSPSRPPSTTWSSRTATSSSSTIRTGEERIFPTSPASLPSFSGGRLSFFVANRAHHSDVGGMTPGSMPLATEIFQEGLIIPPLKLVRRGRTDEDVLKLILANVRTPEERRGDLQAQIASCEKGKQRIGEAVRQFGLAKIGRYAALIQDYTETFLRRTIREIPDGEYRFSDHMDNDGISDDPVEIRVRIRIRGERAVVDFRGSSPQVPGGVNANAAVTSSAVLYVFRSLIEEDIPSTTGLMRPLSIIAPPGLVVSAVFPAATAAGNVETSQRITDVLLGRPGPGRSRPHPRGQLGNDEQRHLRRIRSRAPPALRLLRDDRRRHGGQQRLRRPGRGPHPHDEFPQHPGRSPGKTIFPSGSGDTAFGRARAAAASTREAKASSANTSSPFRPGHDHVRAPGLPALRPPGRRARRPGRNTLVSSGKSVRLGSKANFRVRPGDLLRIETPGGGGYGRRRKP